MTIDDRWKIVGGRPSGFDYMRIILAVTILVWHAYPVSRGTKAASEFWRTSLSGHALAILLPMFFALSGFLVAGSMYRNPDLRKFLTLRLIRIYPALVVEAGLSALLLGPFLTTVPLVQYFTDRKFLLYLMNTIGWVHFYLPGVFPSNPQPELVNGQLWTVPFELECYVLITVIAILGFFRLRLRVIPIFALATLAVLAWNQHSGVTAATPGGWSGRILILCFLGGVTIYSFRDQIPWRIDLAIVSLMAASFLPSISDTLTYLTPIFLAYGTVCLGLLNPRRMLIVDSGDYSYGVFLYHYPIEQTVQYFLGGDASWLMIVTISLPITILFALFSWWCIEKPFLKVRSFVLRGPGRVMQQ